MVFSGSHTSNTRRMRDSTMPKITCLAGGVGAARFLQGLVRVVPPGEVTVIVNTGDDIKLHGLHISPDVDIVTYTLAGIVDEGKGWGIRDDSFRCLAALGRLGGETWFNLGDADLATHISRTRMIKEGLRLSEVAARHSRALGVETVIIPMTDDPFATQILTNDGYVHFEEYFVKRGAASTVRGVRFLGAEEAKPAPGVTEAIESANGIVICPSNPIVSVGTILSIPGIREALRRTNARVAAVSPIIGGSPVKGPADRIMAGLGLEVSSLSVARLYGDFIDSFVMDDVDADLAEKVRSLGVSATVTNTIMRTLEDKVHLANETLRSIGLV